MVGGLFVGHGAQKLLGSFGGHGLTGTAGFFEGIGLRPGHVHVRAAGTLEFGGGIATAAFALACMGPGSWSADSALGLSMHGVLWGIAALAAGCL